MANETTIIEETTAAARGVLALLVGDKTAGKHFDFSQRGLVGSLIAIVALTGLSALVASWIGAGAGSMFKSAATNVILYGAQIAMTAIVLNQLKRADGFVPYLVADNWAMFWTSLGTLLLAVIGIDPMLVMIAALVGVWLQISIARSIIGLTGGQIAMLFVAQIVGVLIGLLLVITLFPMSASEIAALSSPPA